MSNLQGLCKPCHDTKTRGETSYRDRGRTGHVQVFAVCGPVAAGKTTYVREHRKAGDLVLDLDALIAALGDLPIYQKPESLLPFAFTARDAVLEQLAREQTSAYGAWIIATAPKRLQRNELRRRFNAHVVVLETDRLECLARLYADKRRPEPEQWAQLLAQWWDRYEPDDRDEVIVRG